MIEVATLVTHTAVLGEEHLAAAASVLPDAGRPRWLAGGIAADIPFAPPPLVSSAARAGNACGAAHWTVLARAALGDAPVDVVVQPAEGRRKRLLVADMDGTIIMQECIDELAALAGRRDEVAALTRASVGGAINFDASLRTRVALLAGLTLADVDRVADRLTLDPGAMTLVATMRAAGATTIIVSGGFTLLTAAIAARAGFDRHHGNVLEVADGRLTGRLREPILGRAAKAQILRDLRDELRLAPDDTLAVGDGANDGAMLAQAGLGVAFAAAPAVARDAPARLDHSNLSALLYVQGYAAADFVV